MEATATSTELPKLVIIDDDPHFPHIAAQALQTLVLETLGIRPHPTRAG